MKNHSLYNEAKRMQLRQKGFQLIDDIKKLEETSSSSALLEEKKETLSCIEQKIQSTYIRRKART